MEFRNSLWKRIVTCFPKRQLCLNVLKCSTPDYIIPDTTAIPNNFNYAEGNTICLKSLEKDKMTASERLRFERFIGNNYGYKSNIWIIGLVMLKCATGQFPYSPPQPGGKWENAFELMTAIIGQPAPSAPSYVFSSQFCSFISSCV